MFENKSNPKMVKISTSSTSLQLTTPFPIFQLTSQKNEYWQNEWESTFKLGNLE